MSDGGAIHNAQTMSSQPSLNTGVLNNNASGGSEKANMQSLGSTIANSGALINAKPPITKRTGETMTSQSKREQSGSRSRPTTNRKLSKMSRDQSNNGEATVLRSNSNSLK